MLGRKGETVKMGSLSKMPPNRQIGTLLFLFLILVVMLQCRGRLLLYRSCNARLNTISNCLPVALTVIGGDTLVWTYIMTE